NIVGNTGDNYLTGNGGADTLNGLGGAGSYTYTANVWGNDTIIDTSTFTHLSFSGNIFNWGLVTASYVKANLTIKCNATASANELTDGTNTVDWSGTAIDNLAYGGDGNDILYAANAVPNIYGGKGNDTVYGATSSTSFDIYDGWGHDTLISGISTN